MSIDLKTKIQIALQGFATGNLTDQSLKLFKTLGYKTDRQSPFGQKTFQCFKDSFLDGNTRFDEKKAFALEWKYVDLLFQLSKEEMSVQVSHGRVNDTVIESYLFFAIELEKSEYSRSALAQITREVNKVFPMPVLIVFKHGASITLSVINRRLNKKDDRKDVLEKVTVIKDISIEKPHRAHIEILFDLSFEELRQEHKFTNFVQLHNAWQKTLDTKELNKRFYLELANWYFWAMDKVSFPGDIEKKEDIRNATSLIRLITRIIFIWFIREKDLVPDKFFNKADLKNILREFNKSASSNSYYTAILQNLFFGTLNQQMKERGFVKEGSFAEHKAEYGVKNLFRYADRFSISEKEAVAHFKDIPFLNGGLFDCLDKPDDDGKILYVDGFSRNTKKQAVVPDYLFFSDETDCDLNEIYGTKNKRYKVKGLIEILSSYKFTIAENTPIEEEVALDPELLGKVFENLLASYNPETKNTARKQTGSFYTPREIVHYMVDESLLAYLCPKLEEAGFENTEDNVRELLSYSENPNPFSLQETDLLIEAIDNCKILDPAGGSGAFPMGILHKLVHLLHKLDPKNEQWKKRQVEKARQFEDTSIRDHALEDIENAFENNELDYGRKLYLIENCIYGVDIQPIAVQIAKLRFFISLIIDERKQPNKDNFGIRALPNLETKFVAADSLVAIDHPAQLKLRNYEIDSHEKELKNLRHQYFSAKTRREKLQCQKRDKELRKKIAGMLMKDGWSSESAGQLAAFDPYDQNTSAPFFDAEWMFGLKKGFDIAIGNPPYVQIQSFSGRPEQKLWEKQKYETYTKTGDVYCLFYERGHRLLKSGGILTYITSNKWMRANYGKALRKFFLSHGTINQLIDFADSQIFENATTYTNILVYRKDAKGTSPKAWDLSSAYENHVSLEDMLIAQGIGDPLFSEDSFVIVKGELASIKKRIEEVGIPLKNWDIAINYGIKTGFNEAFIIEGKKKDELIAKDPKSEEILKPILRGRDIKRYKSEFVDLWLVATFPALGINIKNYPAVMSYLKSFGKKLEQSGEPGCRKKTNNKWFEVQDTIAYYQEFSKNKIVWPETSQDNQFCFVVENYYLDKTTFFIASDDKYLLGLLNSKIVCFYLDTLVSKMRGGYFSMSKIYVEQLPIPQISPQEQAPYERLVDCILFAKEHAMNQEASTLEWVVDVMVYGLYFEAEMKKDHCYINDRIAEVIKPFKPNDTDEFKTEHLKTFVKFCNKDDIVCHGLVHSRNVKPVKIISGAKQDGR